MSSIFKKEKKSENKPQEDFKNTKNVIFIEADLKKALI